MFDFNLFKKSIGDLTAQIRKVREEIETLKQRRDLLVMAPPTKADMVAILQKRIDALGEGYPERLVKSLQPWMGANATEIYQQPLGFLLAGQFNTMGQVGDASNLVGGLAYLLRDQFKQGIARAIDAANWPEGSVSLAEREKEIKKLDEKIGQLEGEDKRLQMMAAEAGIILNV